MYSCVTNLTGEASIERPARPAPDTFAIPRNPISVGGENRDPLPQLPLESRTRAKHSHGLGELTTLETLGDAPRCSKFFTIGRCPMKDATWRGVSPD